MSEAAEKATKSTNKPKKSWFKGLKAEYNKIVWPDRKTVIRQTVVLTSIVLGVVIKLLDIILSYGIDMLISL